MAEVANPKRALRIFLCHSSNDKPAVRDLCHRLRADGVDPWLDEEKLLPGQYWEQEIPKAVRNSDVVVVCLSQGSITKSGYVQKEIKYALDAADEHPEGAIFLIPLKLEECNIPDRLRHLHYVSLHDESGYDRLIASLQKRAKTIDAAPIPIQKGKHGLTENWNNIRKDRKAVVYEVQRFLAAKGYHTGPVDGIPGPNTKKAVRQFQVESGLTPDGLIGPEILQTLEGCNDSAVPTFKEITAQFIDIKSDPDHHEKVVYSFTVSPAPSVDWQAIFEREVWPFSLQFSPHMKSFFAAPNLLTVKCYVYDEESGLVGEVKEAVAQTNRRHREIIQEIARSEVERAQERQAKEAERERLIRGKMERLKSDLT